MRNLLTRYRPPIWLRRNATHRMMCLVMLFAAIMVTGCHDGPLYALKHANPYFTMKEWRDDEQFGVTDHERRNQLIKLTKQISEMPRQRQTFWAGHLNRIIDTDPSPEMRRLAVNAAGKLGVASSIPLIQKGLDDDSIKVRMEACRSLSRRREPQAVQLLAATIGNETEQDVRHAALSSLANHNSAVAINSLRNALEDRDPATRDIAMSSLRRVTGKAFGGNPDQWLRALNAPSLPTIDPEIQIAQTNAPLEDGPSLPKVDLPNLINGDSEDAPSPETTMLR